MRHDPITFTYTFRFKNEGDRDIAVQVVLDPDTFEQIPGAPRAAPEWTRLEFHRCRVCPLDATRHTHCPAAQSLTELVEEFGKIISFTEVDVIVRSKERRIHAITSAQKALSSLVGLRMATCGCPVLAKFRPMARFHLPFATVEETVFRAASTYLLAQYFLKLRGRSVDLELSGLRDLYADIHDVNVGLSSRLQGLDGGDANVNAVVLLDLFAHELPFSIEDNLGALEKVFAPYFD